MTKSTVMGNTNTKMTRNITGSGRKTFAKGTELIIIRMVIDTKATGISIFKAALELTITQMAIFTKESG